MEELVLVKAVFGYWKVCIDMFCESTKKHLPLMYDSLSEQYSFQLHINNVMR